MRLPKSFLLTAVIVIVVLVILRETRTISAPIVLALSLGVIVSPLVERAARLSIPPVATALCITFGTCLAVLGGALALAPAIETAMDEVPHAIHKARDTLEGIMEIGRNIDEVSQEVTEAIGTGDPGKAAPAAEGAAPPLPSFWDAVLLAPTLAGQALIFLGTLFFFLLTRRDIYVWIGDTLPSTHPTLPMDQLLLAADRSVSRYFLTITAINAALGVCVASGLFAMGLPAAGTWGLVAFLVNYLLYLGPALLAVSLLIAGLLAFPGVWSYAPAAMYVGMNFLEGYFVTPTLLGQRLDLNPLLIFLTLTVWLWLWGPVGGIVALPTLVWVLAATGAIEVTEAGGARVRPRVAV